MPIKALNRYQNREDGFTLIELLIVVLIIGILAAIAIPVYLGIQNQGYKSAVRADVNISVKRVQVALTEGKSMAEVKTNQTPYTQRSVKGEVVQILDSNASGASTSDYQVKGVSSTTSSPAGPINYSYIYDSVSGKFTESDAAVLGSSIPSTTITTSALPDATKDAAYSATVSASTTNPGGTTVYSATGLPTTLTIDGGTGKITGTPTTTGTYSVTVTASNAGVSDSKTYNLNVYSTPVITTGTLPNGTYNTAYSQTIVVTGTPTPTVAVTSGALPTGLNLTAAGVLSGTPSANGSYTFAVTPSNSAGTGTPVSYTVVIGSKPVITTAQIIGGIQNSGAYTKNDNAGYVTTVAATGYPSPTFTATGLPSGMGIDASTGLISGTPGNTATNYPITVTATNTFGSTPKNYTFNVSANILTNPSFETGNTSSWNVQAGNGGSGVYGSIGCPNGANGPHAGSKFLLYGTQSSNYIAMLQDVSATIPAGYSYSGGMWVSGCDRAVTTGNVYLVFFNGATQVGVKNVSYSTNGGWTYVSISGDAPAAATTVRLQIVPDKNQDNIDIDDANLGLLNWG